MKIVIIGGTGLVGRPHVGLQRVRGHDVVAGSSGMGIDALTCAGLAQALTDAADLTFFRGTPANLLDAPRAARRESFAARIPLSIGHMLRQSTNR